MEDLLNEFAGAAPVEAVDTESMREAAMKRIGAAESYWSPFHQDMEEDFRFAYTKDHWGAREKAVREKDGRPVLVIPMIKKFVKRIVGESKKRPPSIKLTARGGEDAAKAEVFNGTVRYIEDRCGAQYAYTGALEQATVCGLGFFRVNYKAVDGGARYVISIEPVDDCLRVLLDPDSRALDGSDARHVTVAGDGKDADGKATKTYEHYWVDGDGAVRWCFIDGNSVTDHGEWPVRGEGLPIIPVYGETVCFRGERVIQGVVRDLIDPQKAYNYLESQRVEVIALTPKSPVIAARGSLVAPDEWAKAAQEPVAYLEYEPYDEELKPLPAPTRMQTTPDVAWVSQSMADVKQHFSDATGIYDSNLGNERGSLSGKAILAKQDAGDYSQVGYTEHLQMSIRRAGNMTLKLIPVVMGNEQVLNILGEDGQMKAIPRQGVDAQGVPYRLDLDPRDIDLSVSSAPAYATRRQEFVDSMTNVMSAMPASAAILGDLVVRNMDFPGAGEAADRLYKSLPPALKEKQGWVPKEIADQMQQQTQTVIQQLQQQLAQANAKTAQLEHQLQEDRELQMATERMRSETTLAKASMEQQGDAQLKAMDLLAQQERDNAKIAADLLKERAKNPAPVVVVAPQAPDPSTPAHGRSGYDMTYRPAYGPDGRPVNPLA